MLRWCSFYFEIKYRLTTDKTTDKKFSSAGLTSLNIVQPIQDISFYLKQNAEHREAFLWALTPLQIAWFAPLTGMPVYI